MPTLTKPQYAVLESLDANGPLDQVSLGEASAIKRGTLTDMLARMERKGLIQRSPSLHDARQKQVEITDDGLRMLAMARLAADKVNQDLTRYLTSTENQELLSLLQKISSKIPSINP
ncbi:MULTISPECIES: MarR family winged helix-turn-helix transcriptional regulator [Vibrio]|nr:MULTISPECIES: MarR family winged helix-turn-helix transcriptional regulator [Vibrio]MBF9002931.1 winged helix-turn-helix transcriptional regulator [Vibrio nitrifigilis]